MTDVTIRIASSADYQRAAEAYETWGYRGGLLPSDVVFLAERGDALVGVVRRTVEHGTVMLRGMWVAPTERRRGVGRELLRAFAADLGGRECFCVPFAHLVDFYVAGGFALWPEECAPRFLAERIDRYRSEGLRVAVMRRPGRLGTADASCRGAEAPD